MVTLAEHEGRINRVENRVDVLTEDTNQLKGAYEHLATKADIAELKAWTMWRVLVGAALIQGIVAAAIKYLP